jgi:hypothetical protein
LQDLVFNTIGNDSLDLPQIVSNRGLLVARFDPKLTLNLPLRQGCGRITICRKVVGA